LKKRILALFIVLLLTGVTVALKILSSPLVDNYLRTVLVEQAEENLGVRLKLGSLERNTLLTRITLTDVVLADLRGEGGEIKARRLSVRLDPLATFRGTIAIKDLALEGIDILVIRDDKGNVSVDPLFPFWERQQEKPVKPVQAVRLDVGNVTLIDVNLAYVDQPAGFDVRLEKVLIQLKRRRFGPADHRDMLLTARGGDLAWRAFPAGKAVTINSIKADVNYTGRTLEVHDLAVSSGPIDIKLAGSLPFDPTAEMAGDVNVAVNLDRLPWLIGGGRGTVEISGDAAGSLEAPAFTGKVSGKGVSVAGRTFKSLAANVFIDQDGGELANGTMNYREKELDVEMAVSFVRGLPFTAAVGIKDYPFQYLLEEIGGYDGEARGAVSARCELGGRLTGLGEESSVSAALTGKALVPVLAGDPRPMDFSLAGNYQRGEFVIDELGASSKTLTLQADGRLGPGGPSVSMQLEEKDLGSWLGGVRSTGTARISGELGGTWSAPSGEYRVAVEGVSWKGYSVEEVEAQLEVGADGLNLPLLTLRLGSSSAAMQGYVPWDTEAEDMFWIIELKGGDLADLLSAAGSTLDIQGLVTTHLAVSGRGQEISAGGDVELTDLVIYGEKFDLVAAEALANTERVSFSLLEIVKDGRKVTGTGSLSEEGFEVDLATVDPLNLDGMSFLKDIRVFLGGDINLRVKGSSSYDLKKVQATAMAQWDSITFEGRPWHGGSGSFQLNDRLLTGDGSLLDDAFSAQVAVELVPGLPFSGTISTPDRASVQDINDFIGINIPGDIVSGSLAAAADARGLLTAVKGTVVEGVIENAAFSVKGLPFESSAPVDFRFVGAEGIKFSELRLKNREAELKGPLRIGPAAALEGRISGEIDLTGFSFLDPTVDSFEGLAGLDLKVSGKITDPLLRGFLETDGVNCVARLPFPLKVTSLTGRAEVVGDRLHFDRLRGRANGGSLVMEGDIFFSGLKPSKGDLTWTGESVTIDYPEGLSTVNRANVSMRFADKKGVVRGALSMDEGKYERDVDIDNLIAIIGERKDFYAESDEVSSRDPGNGDWLALDIQMKTVEPLDVDIRLLKGQASGNLHLQGTAARPVLVGRFEMEEGSIDYRGHSFDVNYGTVGFFDPEIIEPRFNFTGRTEINGLDREGQVRDYSVDLLAEGVPRKFKLDLISSPPLSEVDILSLLTWGAVGEQAFATRGGLTATEATLLLTREFKGQLESGVERLTGFDRFVIDPTAISSSGERTTRIQVDKKLGDNMSLTYSTPILSSEEQEVTLRYRISNNLSLIGEQKGESDYGLDLDFQFEIP
jgi:autotransporter translocation and assembly factor TamB